VINASASAIPTGKGVTLDNNQPFPIVGWIEVGYAANSAVSGSGDGTGAFTKTLFDLNGKWASGGIPGPVVSVTGNSIAVDMSVYHRPAAHGSVLDDSHITVTFPDDKTYTGTLQLPNIVKWSNNSEWTKV